MILARPYRICDPHSLLDIRLRFLQEDKTGSEPQALHRMVSTALSDLCRRAGDAFGSLDCRSHSLSYRNRSYLKAQGQALQSEGIEVHAEFSTKTFSYGQPLAAWLPAFR